MTTKDSAQLPRDLIARRMKVRTLVSTLLPKAFNKQSNTAVGRRIGKSAKTISRWLRRETPVDYEAVLADPIIGPRFRELLCIHDHDEEFPSARRR